MKVWWIAALTASTVYGAPGLECRSPDPDFVHADVTLAPNAKGKYDVFFVYAVHAGDMNRPDPGRDAPITLASNLDCAFSKDQPLLVSCRKSSLDENERTNSFFVSTRRVENTLDDSGAPVQSESIWLSVFSPYTDAHANEGPYNVEGTMRFDYVPRLCSRTDL